MQEVLQDAGVSWKVYSPSNVGVSGKYASLAQYPTWNPALYNPVANPEVMVAPTTCCRTSRRSATRSRRSTQKAFRPTFPNDFVADIASGSLPSVSWIIPPLGFDEHPSASPANGMYFTSLVLDALTANPERVVEDRAVPDVRRERRLVRPRAAADTAGRHAGRVPDRDAAKLGSPRPGRRSASPGRSASVCGCRCW